MKKIWTNHCKDAEEKREFKEILAHSDRVLSVLKDILKDKYDGAARDRRSIKSLLTQNYSEWQADRNATERTILEILDLLQLEKNDD